MMTDWDEFIETFAYWTHWKPAKPQAIDEADKARAALRAAITELEQERDNLKTVLHGNQDADYDKQLQIETLKSQLAEAEADADRLAMPQVNNDNGKLICPHCGGWGWQYEGALAVDHDKSCPVFIHQSRVKDVKGG